jgi:SsrA-binding protein
MTAKPDAVGVNRKARHDYHVETTLEAGLVLEGWEVKSLRAHRVHFTGAFARIVHGEVWLYGLGIEPLPTVRAIGVDPTRARKILLSKAEIQDLQERVDRAGMTLVPLRVYEKRGRMKLALGLARGKNAPDKRQALKEKSIERDRRREGG